jgi:hypothetical protein
MDVSLVVCVERNASTSCFCLIVYILLSEFHDDKKKKYRMPIWMLADISYFLTIDVAQYAYKLRKRDYFIKRVIPKVNYKT